MPKDRGRGSSQNLPWLDELGNAAPNATNSAQKAKRPPKNQRPKPVSKDTSSGSQQTTTPVQPTETVFAPQATISKGTAKSRPASTAQRSNPLEKATGVSTSPGTGEASTAKPKSNNAKSKPDWRKRQAEKGKAKDTPFTAAGSVVIPVFDPDEQTLSQNETVQLPSNSDLDIEGNPFARELEALCSLVLPLNVLQRKGYILNVLSMGELEGKKRCSGCGKPMFKCRNKDREELRQATARINSPMLGKFGGKNALGQTRQYSQATTPVGANAGPIKSQQRQKPLLLCKFHDGFICEKTSVFPMSQPATSPASNVRPNLGTKRVWSCCSQPPSSAPCSGAPFHEPCFYEIGEIEALWQYHPTPRPSLKVRQSGQIRPAVALDCEMGTAKSGDSELIRISLVDHFTSEVLIDQLVFPNVPMSHLNTRYSGVTWKDMNEARSRGACIFGRDKARRKVWEYVGPETIVIGHSLNNDLASLRWIHRKVVDTFLIEFRLDEKLKAEQEAQSKGAEVVEEAETEPDGGVSLDSMKSQDGKNPDGDKETEKKKPGKGNGHFSLKTLARTRLGREIQNKGKEGHDSLEDAIAARDLADWHVKKALGMIEETSGQGSQDVHTSID